MKILPLRLLLLFVFVSLGFSGLAQKSKSNTLPRYTPKYTFEPPQRDSVASANVTIALLKPVFLVADFNGKNEEPYNTFSNKMVNDIEALLTAKGYKVRGPFTTRDEMVFNDKQNSDFTLEITIDYNAEVQRNWKSSVNILSGLTTHKVKTGTVNITTAVVITAKANYTGEKLWKKNLDLGLRTFEYQGSVKWEGQDLSFKRELTEDNSFWNPYTKQLEIVYADALSTLWKQFDVGEMRSIAKEAKKERERNKN
jgi:hypothetical protein